MQAVFDLGVLDFAEVAVDLQHELAKVIRLFIHAQVAMQLGLLNHFPDLRLQGGQLGRVESLALVVLIHELLQFGDVAVGVSGGHGRDQVINDRGVGTALGLGALAGVVHDEGIEQRDVVQGNLRITRLGQADALAG